MIKGGIIAIKSSRNQVFTGIISFSAGSDNANFVFDEAIIDGHKVVVLIIYKAIGKIVTFKGQEYIRIGSAKKKLKDFPAMESELWDKINGAKYEEMAAMKDLEDAEALSLID